MNKFILLYFVLMIGNIVYTQNNFGFFVGITYPGFSESGFANGGNMNGDEFGHKIGVLYNLKINKKIDFQPKLMIATIGDRHKTTGNYYNFQNIDYKLTYLYLPLNFKFFSKPYFTTGPQFGYLLKNKIVSEYHGDLESNLDFGLNLGVGYEFRKIFIEAGLYQGFTTVFKVREYRFPNLNIDAKNIYLQFHIGYCFL